MKGDKGQVQFIAIKLPFFQEQVTAKQLLQAYSRCVVARMGEARNCCRSFVLIYAQERFTILYVTTGGPDIMENTN